MRRISRSSHREKLDIVQVSETVMLVQDEARVRATIRALQSHDRVAGQCRGSLSDLCRKVVEEKEGQPRQNGVW
jgi:hypothetical protein